jgi:hypothetical protein
MRRLISSALAAALIGTTMAASVAPAMADPDRDRYIEQFYDRHGHDDSYWYWKRNHSDWRDDDYHRWYRGHHDDFDNPAAAIFGFAAGALAAGAAAAIADNSHVARCDAEYRSYDPASDTYLGYDGQRHYCRL